MADHKRLYISLLWIMLSLSCVVALPTRVSSVESPVAMFQTSVGFSMGYGGKYKSSYDRSDEVEKKCKAILSSSTSSSSLSTQDRPDPSWAIENELSFENGDWDQAAGSSPLLPFKVNQNDSKVDPVQLASFWITDVNLKGDKKQEKLISAVLELNIGGINQGRGYSSNSNEDFGFFSGLSTLTILMEGLYIESEGDRSVCMLGCTVLPLRSSNGSNPWSDLTTYSTSSPPTTRSCNLMLRLHYRKEMSLTSRAINGDLTSLSNPDESSYFDPVSLVSQLGAYSTYQFKHGDLAEAACKGATPAVKDTEVYRGDRFCATVMQLLNGQWLEPLSNWKCNKSEEYCTKLGPFKSRDGLPLHRNGSQILIQDIRCVELEDEHLGRASNFSAFFRAVLPNQNPNVAILRSGLDGLTLVTEGMWKKSSGQLCMIACANGSRADCKVRICLYIPTALSITRRDMVVGTISSLDGNGATSFDPLSFHLMIYPRVLPRDLGMHYKYSKINYAGAILEREVPLGLSDKIKLSLLKYPSNGSYNSLSEDLTVYSAIIPPTPYKTSHLRSYLDFDIIAVEDFIATDWTHVSNISVEEGIEAAEDRQHRTGHVGPEEKGELVKVAAQLRVTGLERIPVISGEGVYNPKTGKMYLVGCRELSVPWQVLQNNSFDLVDGLDCNVEVILQFPPKNAQWLVNPTVSLTITSRRTEDDPFFSPQLSLQTFPILYQEQRQEIISRKSLEGGLSLVTLSLIVACIACQLIYIRNNRDPVPFISLVMLGVQAMGYGVPLIVGAEALFARLFSEGDEPKSSILKDGEWTQVIMYVVKLLILMVFLLNLRLCQKVVKARIRLGTRHPLEPGRVPSEKKILLIFFLVHAIGFLLVLTIHSVHKSQNQVNAVTYVDWEGTVKKEREWVKEMREYGGLMQDLFLLPQVLGGAIWEVNGKPLRRLYYIGLTVLRMLPHAYDALRTPLFNPYFADEYIYANPRFDFYSRAGDVAIPLLALALAIAVYVQQRWNGVKWGKVIQTGSSKMMRYGSRIYQRLPSKLFEAELMPSIPTSSSHEVLENGNGHLQESMS